MISDGGSGGAYAELVIAETGDSETEVFDVAG